MRFPEFEGEWETKKLGELLEFKNGINASKEQYGSGYKFINVLDILNNEFITYDRIIGSVNVNKDVIDKFPVNYGDILFQRSSETREEVGTTSVYLDQNKTATFGGFVIRGKKIGVYEPIFLNKLLKTDIVRNQITSKSGGSTRYNVGQEILASIHLFLPSFSEQTKIASLLSLIDERIQTQNKIIEELKLLKITISKKLFSRQLRFKNGNNENYIDWNTKKLGEVTTLVNKRNKNNEKLPVYSINNKLGFVPQSEQFEGVDSEDRGYDIKLYKIINKNTFAYNPARINVGSIGYSENLENIIISSLYVCFKTDNTVNDNFLYQYLKTDFFNREVLRNVEGGVRDYLFYDNFARIKFDLPCIEEQKKIADYLSSIDSKIDIENQLLHKFEKQKRYLLANLFI